MIYDAKCTPIITTQITGGRARPSAGRAAARRLPEFTGALHCTLITSMQSFLFLFLLKIKSGSFGRLTVGLTVSCRKLANAERFAFFSEILN